MTSSSDIRESQSTTIPESEDGETTLVSPTPDSSTDSLHSQGISPYPASQPPSPSPYDDDDSSKNNGFPTICVIILIHDKDISRIPLNYELSLKRLIPFNSRFDYVIKGKIFNKLISRSLIVIPAGWYEVQEFRYDKDGKFTHKVLTTLCHIEFGLSSLWSAPDVDIQFTTYPPLNLTKKLTLQESMKYCKWKISWTIIMNGYIHKLCPKNLNITENNNTGSFDSQDYEKVAYFKGFEFFGFTFLSLDSKINYGYTTIPNILNMMSRSVYITKDAPFPPIIPAIYTAYYNFITNSRSSISYKHKNS
ncbi:7902_t:CDS:2 [Rhizophagus irregularis]|nr:7902_t:CDS:2 [Rhizophagus irregularis]